jgi:hypothetical protein
LNARLKAASALLNRSVIRTKYRRVRMALTPIGLINGHLDQEIGALGGGACFENGSGPPLPLPGCVNQI